MKILFSVHVNNSRIASSKGMMMGMRVILCLLLLLVLVQGVLAVETYVIVTRWGNQGTGNGQFNNPQCIAVDSSGNVYVADTSNNRIQKFSSTGTFLAKWGTQGSGDGQFQNPMGVAVDSSGNVYVADQANERIQKFSSTGTFLAKWGSGSLGHGDGQFYNPMGVAIDSSGNVYVDDTSNFRIQKFSSDGKFLTKWGSYGSGDGQFVESMGIAVDSSGNVYVTDGGNAGDIGNYRIQKFSSDGKFLTKWGTQGSGDGQFSTPIGVAVDSSGDVYVVDIGNYRIQKFSSDGKFLTKWGTQGDPQGIAVDSSGNVYVTVYENQIQKFAIQTVTPIATQTSPPAKNLFITINPIKDKYSGEKFTITGSTNISVGNPLQIEVTSSSKRTQTSGLSVLMTGTGNVLAGIDGINMFSFDVNASTFTPDEYIVKVSGSDGNIASTSLFTVLTGTRPINSVTVPITATNATPTIKSTVKTYTPWPTSTPTQATPPSQGIDRAGYAGIILVIVIFIVIGGAAIYVVNARKESRHLRGSEPAKKSATKKSSAPQSQSKPPAPQKMGDTPFIQPITPKQLPPELSDRYTEFELIGKGGFARVFKAKRKDGQYVALKIPISLDAQTGKTFMAELQNWTKLDHPNIVRVFDCNIMPLPYFEMELCDGSLAEAKKPMDCEEAAWIIFHVCEGLKYAHALSIAHRDLKPQNILIKDDIPKISDWGLSKIISESTSTTSGAFTLYYAAPEQLNNKQKDERTDIWQLGVILYELTTGTLPFTGETISQVAVNISTKPYTRPSELNPNIREIEQIIGLCLEKDPDKRFQSVTALQRSLGLYLRQNYAEMFKQSVTAHDIRRSAYYVGDLIIVNLIIGDLTTAYKYSTDLEEYAKGDAKALAHEFCDQLYIRIQNNVTEVPDELIKKAEFVVHKVLMGF